MGDILELAERFWQGQIPARDLWRPTYKSEELGPGVVFFHPWANVTAIRTDGELVLVDTGNFAAHDRTFAAVRAVDDGPLYAAVYTHGHADHACGLGPFLVSNVWRLYGGWWDGQPAHLKPAPESEIGGEVAALAGGPEALAECGSLALARHVVDWAAAAAPDNERVHAARADIYEARSQDSDALMTRGIFFATARESAAKAGRAADLPPGQAPTRGG